MEFEPIETQEAFDAAIRERISRAQRAEREKYADYEQLKAKAAEYDKAQEAEKGDLQKAREAIERLKKSAAERDEADKLRELRTKVSKATGVPAELIGGSDEEAMTASAKAIAEFAKKPSAPSVGKPGSFAKDGAGGDSEKREFVRRLSGKTGER